MSKQHCDLIAIGGGSGGLAVAATTAQFGTTVAVIEDSGLWQRVGWSERTGGN